jgi:hypothetical protein
MKSHVQEGIMNQAYVDVILARYEDELRVPAVRRWVVGVVHWLALGAAYCGAMTYGPTQAMEWILPDRRSPRARVDVGSATQREAGPRQWRGAAG